MREIISMTRVTFICSILILLAIPAYAQKGKDWTEWTQKEADKILNDSAWGQTQTEGGGSSEQPSQTNAITTTTRDRERNATSVTAAANSAQSGETKATPALHLRVRFMSAKPIRAAFVRMLELQGAPAEKVAQIKPFVDYDFSNYIVVTVNMDGDDRRRMATIVQELAKTDPATLKPATYLERKDGKRLELMDYRPATDDGLGAKFVFPRNLDNAPFLDANSGDVRFVISLGNILKINRRFKVSDMMYEGKLEY
jgi:hypothetical protein